MRRDTPAWLGARALTRRLGLPRAKSFRVERSLPVPMRDGAVLLADHYAPRTRKPAGTLLMRGPYGRDGLPNRVFAGLYARYRGLAVVLITGITFAPLIHAFLYRLHLETKDDEPEA